MQTDELRTVPVGQLMTAQELNKRVPITESCQQLILNTRQAIHSILHGQDARLLVDYWALFHSRPGRCP